MKADSRRAERDSASSSPHSSIASGGVISRMRAAREDRQPRFEADRQRDWSS